MVKRIMNQYALTEQGAKDLIKAIISVTFSDIVLMFPVGLLYYIVADMLKGSISKSNRILYMAGILFILILIAVTAFIQYNATFFAAYKESGAKRIVLAEKLRMLPLSYFGKKDLTDLTSTVLSDTEAMEHTMSHQIPQFYGAIISTVITSVPLFVFNVKMAIAALWVLPVSLIIVFSSKKVQLHFAKKHKETTLELQDGIQEFIEASRDLKSNNAEKEYFEKLKKNIYAIEGTAIRNELGTAVFVISAQLLLKFGIATTALVGSSLLVKGEINILIMFMFMLVVSRIYEPMSAALVSLAALNQLQVNVNRMKELENYPEQTGEDELHCNGYDIEFQNVGFEYNDDETILTDVSFTAKQNEVTALVGPSGGGKTTVSRLAARFFDISHGKITVGGMDIGKVEPEKLLSLYSIVFQDVTLFNNTVMENIRIGKKDATDEEVLAAAKLANVDEFALKLPQGYHTGIGENGCRLSGGERQRISIARAFLKDAPIILLDEATASLDVENETVIQQAISRLIKNKTVLVIAHRLRTVAGADKIVVLKDGHVAEQGAPDKLMSQKGVFANMVKLQQQSENWNLK